MSLGHFQYKMFSVTAEGFAVDELVPVEITDEGHFKIETPHYINTVMSVHEVEATDLQTAIDFYGKLCEQYQSMRLQPGSGKKVLLMEISADSDGGVDSPGSYISLGYLVDTEVDGRLLKYEFVRHRHTVIPDTPENRAKLDAMIDSMKVAARLLDELKTTGDPVAYLHAIQFAAGPVIDMSHADPEDADRPVIDPDKEEAAEKVRVGRGLASPPSLPLVATDDDDL